MFLKFLGFAISLSLVSATLPNDFLSTFHSSATCSGGLDDTSSSVIAPQQLCQVSGDGKTSYAVFCDASSVNGTVVYCKDSKCSMGCVDAPFLSGQCLVGGSVGASAQSFTCLPSSSTIVDEPGCDRCQITYHSDSICRVSDPFSRSIVDIPMGLCQVDSPTSSWIVFGNNSDAQISWCTDSNCASCKSTRSVSRNECFSNGGGSNLRISCGNSCANNPIIEIIDPVLVGAFPLVQFTDSEIEEMPFDFKATYFSSGTCSTTDTQSTLIAQQNFCQQSGGRSYQVFCDESLNNGTVIFYSDQLCALDANMVFFANGQCLASDSNNNDIAATGVSWQCLSTKNTQIAPPTFGRCAVSFFELEDCKGDDRSIVNVVSGICQVDGERSWMILSNETDSTAVIAWCDDAMCSDCPMTSTIARDQCIGSNGEGPSGPGSRGVRAICGTNTNTLPPNTQAVIPTRLPLPQSPTSKPTLTTIDPYAVKPKRPLSSPSSVPIVQGPAIDPYAVKPKRPLSSPSSVPIVQGPAIDPYAMKPKRPLSSPSSVPIVQGPAIDPYAVKPKRPSSSPSSVPIVQGPAIDPYAVKPKRPSSSPSSVPIVQGPAIDPYAVKPKRPLSSPSSVPIVQGPAIDPYAVKPKRPSSSPAPIKPSVSPKPRTSPSSIPVAAPTVGQQPPVNIYNTKPNVALPRPVVVDPYITRPNVAQPRPVVVDPYITRPNVAQPRPVVVDPYITRPNVAQPRPVVVDPYNPNVASPFAPYKNMNVAQPKPDNQYLMPNNIARPRRADPYFDVASRPRIYDQMFDSSRFPIAYNDDIMDVNDYYGFVYPSYGLQQRSQRVNMY